MPASRHIVRFLLACLLVGMALSGGTAPSPVTASPITASPITASRVTASGEPAPARWYDSGHRVVAAVAWDALQPAVRDSVVQILRRAPADADLASLFPDEGSDRERAFFMHASTWPDRVRDEAFPERRAAYHRGRWHYVNVFWVQTPDGPLVLEDRTPAAENAAERLKTFLSSMRDPSVPAEERAVRLSWILHLVGDLHQPLHASSHVSYAHPDGDRGGGLIPLPGSDVYSSLHTYWDGILDLSYPRQNGESDAAYASRLASGLPTGSDGAGYNGPDTVDAWLRESAEVARMSVYRPVVQAGVEPPPLYRRHTLRIAEDRLRRAGERLAAALNHVFGADSAASAQPPNE